MRQTWCHKDQLKIPSQKRCKSFVTRNCKIFARAERSSRIFWTFSWKLSFEENSETFHRDFVALGEIRRCSKENAGYHGSRTGLFIGRGSLDCEGMSYQRLNMHTIERPALGWPRTDLLRAKANKLINKTRAALFAARLLWVYFWFILNVSSLLFACRTNRRIRTSQFDVPTRVRRMWVLSRSERENHISAGH